MSIVDSIKKGAVFQIIEERSTYGQEFIDKIESVPEDIKLGKGKSIKTEDF